MDFDQLVRSGLDEACAGLLPSLESRFLAEKGSAPRTAEGQFRALAVVGFAGDEVRGTLTVAASALGLERVRRAHSAIAGPGAIDEALGQLARQVTHRFANHLARHGVVVAPSSQIVVRGNAIELCSGAASHQSEYSSVCGDDRVEVHVDAHAEPDVSFTDEACDEGVISEGEALLF